MKRVFLYKAVVVVVCLATWVACGQKESSYTQPANPAGGSAPKMPPVISTDAAAPKASSDSEAGTLSAAGITLDVPSDWVKEQPASAMRLAQYSLPGPAGAAELTVFAFGSGMGGGVQANIDRWIGQFENPDNPAEPVTSESNSFEQNGLKVWIVKAAGTYKPIAMGPMVPAGPPQPNSALYGIIVEGGGQGTLFVKVTGPKATVDAQSTALKGFAKSARKS